MRPSSTSFSVQPNTLRIPADTAWRVITSFAAPPTDTPEALRGSVNMAVDQALFESAQAGGAPALRFYRWSPACLSLGRNQPTTIDQERLRLAGVDLVRRPTGGLAVLHDQELTYSLAVKSSAVASPRAVYLAINRGLLRGIAALGAQAVATEQDTSAAAFPKSGSCFAATAPGELMAAGRKLIGSAQRCEHRTILQHGSILVAGDQSLAAAAFAGGATHPRAHSVTLEELLGSVPDWAELTRAFATGVAEELGILLAPGCLTNSERNRAQQLVEHFDSDVWTWRV